MLTCLIVEDRRPIREELIEILGEISAKIKREIKTVESSDYDEALLKIGSAKPDFILLDLALKNPSKTGHHLFINVIVPKQIPTIIITAENESGLVAQLYVPYDIPFLEKPVNEEQLLFEIQSLLNPENAAYWKRRYELISRVTNSQETLGREILIKDENYTSIELKNILYVKTTSTYSQNKIDSKCECYIKGYDGPVFCNEEIGRFEKRLTALSFDFVRVGRDYIINRTHVIKKESVGCIIKLSNNDAIKVSVTAFNLFVAK